MLDEYVAPITPTISTGFDYLDTPPGYLDIPLDPFFSFDYIQSCSEHHFRPLGHSTKLFWTCLVRCTLHQISKTYSIFLSSELGIIMSKLIK